MGTFRRVASVVLAAASACAAALGGDLATGTGKTHRFDHTTSTTIPEIGSATPYPSTITVSGVNAPIGEVKVILHGLHHASQNHLSILLVGPTGSAGNAAGNVLLMGRVWEFVAMPTPNTYIIAQDAPPFPLSGTPADGRYSPTLAPGFTPGLSAPAPAGPYGSSLSVFAGGVANGTWSLFVIDQVNLYGGALAGWSLIIEEPAPPATASTAAAALSIPGGAPVTSSGPASRYPSPVLVDGLVGKVQSVRVMLHGLSHTYQSDVRVLLQGPGGGGGQTCVLYSRCGLGGPAWSNAELVFDDAAPGVMPTNALAGPGVYKPTVCGFSSFTLASPAPAPPYGTTLSVFNGTNPNGVWNLWIEDVVADDTGQLARGWTLIVNEQVCRADFDGSGAVTINDIFIYLNAWFAGCP